MVIYYLMHGTDNFATVFMTNSLAWLIGGQGITAGCLHIFFGPKIAASIGWKPSPFEYEVGVANLGIGVAGIMAGSYGRQYWLALIIVSTIFLWGAAIGHIWEMIKNKTLPPIMPAQSSGQTYFHHC